MADYKAIEKAFKAAIDAANEKVFNAKLLLEEAQKMLSDAEKQHAKATRRVGEEDRRLPVPAQAAQVPQEPQVRAPTQADWDRFREIHPHATEEEFVTNWYGNIPAPAPNDWYHYQLMFPNATKKQFIRDWFSQSQKK